MMMDAKAAEEWIANMEDAMANVRYGILILRVLGPDGEASSRLLAFTRLQVSRARAALDEIDGSLAEMEGVR